MCAVMFGIWFVTSRGRLVSAVEQLADETESELQNIVYNLFTTPPIIANLAKVGYISGDIDDTGPEYFGNMLDIFNETGGGVSAIFVGTGNLVVKYDGSSNSTADTELNITNEDWYTNFADCSCENGTWTDPSCGEEKWLKSEAGFICSGKCLIFTLSFCRDVGDLGYLDPHLHQFVPPAFVGVSLEFEHISDSLQEIVALQHEGVFFLRVGGDIVIQTIDINSTVIEEANERLDELQEETTNDRDFVVATSNLFKDTNSLKDLNITTVVAFPATGYLSSVYRSSWLNLAFFFVALGVSIFLSWYSQKIAPTELQREQALQKYDEKQIIKTKFGDFLDTLDFFARSSSNLTGDSKKIGRGNTGKPGLFRTWTARHKVSVVSDSDSDSDNMGNPFGPNSLTLSEMVGANTVSLNDMMDFEIPGTSPPNPHSSAPSIVKLSPFSPTMGSMMEENDEDLSPVPSPMNTVEETKEPEAGRKPFEMPQNSIEYESELSSAGHESKKSTSLVDSESSTSPLQPKQNDFDASQTSEPSQAVAKSSGVDPKKRMLKRMDTLRRIQDTEQRAQSNITKMVIATIALVVVLGVIWLIWTNLTEDAVTNTTNNLMAKTRDRFVDTVDDFLSHAVHATEIVSARLSMLDNYRFDNATTADKYFTGAVQAFSSISGEYVTSMIYVGYDNGDFFGCEVVNNIRVISTTNDSGSLVKYTLSEGDIRNDANATSYSSSYTSTTRPWYHANNCSHPFGWTDSYVFVPSDSESGGGVLGISATQALCDGPNKIGVVAVDVKLEALSDLLRPLGEEIDTRMNTPQRNGARRAALHAYKKLAVHRLNMKVKGTSTSSSDDNEDSTLEGARSFIIDRKGKLIAATHGDVERQFIIPGRERNCTVQLYGDDSTDLDIHDTSYLLIKNNENSISPNLADINKSDEIRRSRSKPETYVSVIGVSGLDYILVLTVPKEGVLKLIEDDRTMTLLLGIGTALIIVYAIGVSFRGWRKTYTDHWFKERKKKQQIGRVRLSQKDLKQVMEELRHPIMKANHEAWRIKVEKYHSAIHPGAPIPMSEQEKHTYVRAIAHIRQTQRGRNILTQCALEQEGVWPVRIYNLQNGYVYKVFMHVCVIVHIFLAFAEPVSNAQMKEQWDEFRYVYYAEIAFIFIELVDVFVRIELIRRYDVQEFDGIHNFLMPSNTQFINYIHSALIGLVLLDWILTITARFSFEYYFPLRPLIMVIMNPSVRQAASTFIKTVISARDVILLYFAVVLVGAAMGTVLFIGRVNDGDIENSFETFIRSMITAFVFVSTGENYTDVVYEAYKENSLYMFYFLVLTLFGMFFVTAMVTGFFERGFTRMQKEQLKKKKLFDRTGMIAAFVLLDVDRSKKVSETEFTEFMKYVRQDVSEREIEILFKHLNSDRDEYGLDVMEFVRGIEELSVRRLLDDSSESGSRYHWITWMRVRIFERSGFERFVLIIIALQIWVLAMYGTIDKNKESILDYSLSILILLQVLEMCLKVLSFGRREFWFWASYHDKGVFQMFANRVELVIITFTFIMFIYVVISAGGLVFIDVSQLRFPLSFPILRVFTNVRRIRYLVFTLFQVIPPFASVAVLLMVVFFFYGFIGMSAFSGEFNVLTEGEEGGPPANFDDLPRSVITLFQLTVGEGWHEVMYNAILSTDFPSAWYFISFIIIVALLFTNLFIGLILSAFSAILSHNKNRTEMSQMELDRILESRR